MKRKFFAVFLSLCMVMSLVPMTALAAEGESSVEETPSNTGTAEQTASSVASVKERETITYYDSLQTAISEAGSGAIVTLLKQTTVSVPEGTQEGHGAIDINKNITIDGAGHSISTAEKSFGVGTSWGSTVTGKYHVINIMGGTVILKNLTIDGGWDSLTENDKNQVNTYSAARSGINVWTTGASATVTLNSVTVNNCSVYGIVVNGASSTVTATDVTIGENNRWGINSDSNGTFKMCSGEVNADFVVEAGKAEIENGTFNATVKTQGSAPSSALTIEGGTFNGNVTNTGTGEGAIQSISISGGTFTNNVAEYLTEGVQLSQDENGSLRVISEETPSDKTAASVTINGVATNYDTLAAAVSAVNNASETSNNIVLTLQSNQVTTDTLVFEKNHNIIVDLNGYILEGPNMKYIFQFGSFDPQSSEYTNNGTLAIQNGRAFGYRGVQNYFGTVVLDEGLIMDADERLVNTFGGKVTVSGAEMTCDTGFGIALFNSVYASNGNNSNTNSDENHSAKFEMTSGSIDVAYFPITGNNLHSAGTTATISGGTLTANSDMPGIYWPMEGTLNISGSAQIRGGTAVEAKMGTINISGGTLIGTGASNEDQPTNGGSSPEGSALLLSAQMYGESTGQYKTNNNLTVHITGGILTSEQGNAVTVYNTERTTEQEAAVLVTGGQLNAPTQGKAAIKVVTQDSTLTTEVETENGETSFVTKKSQTTVTVSENAATTAAVTDTGTVVYYTDVNRVMDNAGTGNITVYGDDILTENITLPDGKTMSIVGNAELRVADGVTLTGNVTLSDNGMIVSEGNANIPQINGTYTVTFDANGGACDTSQMTVSAQAEITLPAAPTRTGYYHFVGWSDGSKTHDAGDTVKIEKDTTFTAVWSYTPPANPNYKITIGAMENGTVTANPTAAKAGATVTLTPVPDEGYALSTLTVTDRFGDAVRVTEQADGTYTFTMPNGQVTVNATFVETEEPVAEPFVDVAEGDWFYDAVVYAYQNELMDGVGGNRFAPNSETTRAQLVTILYRLEGQPAVSGDLPFTDVEAGIWYTDAILWAAQNNIVNGVSDTEFAPGDDLTRQQLVTILYRYAEAKGYDVSASADLSGYPDADQVQDYAQPAMAWAVAENIIQGMEDGTLKPAGNASRAQIATILMRFCEDVAQ